MQVNFHIWRKFISDRADQKLQNKDIYYLILLQLMAGTGEDIHIVRQRGNNIKKKISYLKALLR